MASKKAIEIATMIDRMVVTEKITPFMPKDGQVNTIAALIDEGVRELRESNKAAFKELEVVLDDNMEHDYDGNRPRLPIETQLITALAPWREEE
jgi:hypothetical protein